MRKMLMNLVIFSLLLVSCRKVEKLEIQSEVQRVTKADDGTHLVLEVGEKLEVSLESNQSTGYSWQLQPNESVSLNSDFYVADDSEMMGAGGIQKFLVEAKKVGRYDLYFIYSRVWEKDVDPAETFHLKLDIN